MIVRCRERGLGTMTWEVARHMNPAKVLVVERDAVDFRDDERFPDARWAKLTATGQLPLADIVWLTSDVDVLYTAETFYDERVIEAARRNHVTTFLHGMWEYLSYRRPRMPRPDVFLAPSSWHLEEWPRPVRLLPVPTAGDRLPTRDVEHVRTIVHCAGAPAKGDRNGTTLLLEALRHVSVDVHVRIVSQAPISLPRLRNRVELEVCPPTEHYWQVFDGADAAVLPRRYGGLSLPLQEATALGLPVIGLTREHDAGYHHAAIVQCSQRNMGLPCGPVERADAEPHLLAKAIDRLVSDPEWAIALAAESRRLARRSSWDALSRTWSDVLGSGLPKCTLSTS